MRKVKPEDLSPMGRSLANAVGSFMKDFGVKSLQFVDPTGEDSENDWELDLEGEDED